MMAPPDGGVLHHYRDNDSGGVYYHPVFIFFGILLLCLCIMAPMFWVLWMMRNDNHDDMMTEEQLHRARDWKRVRAAEQQNQAAQQPSMQDTGVATNATQTRLSNFLEKMREAATSTQQVIVLQSQLLWDKTSESFTKIMRLTPRRSNVPSRTGVSIELPIMRQPAWQKLASGSVDITASTTLVDFSKPTSTEIDMAAPAGPSSHRQARDSDEQTEHSVLGLDGGIDDTMDAETQKAPAATTVGLALG